PRLTGQASPVGNLLMQLAQGILSALRQHNWSFPTMLNMCRMAAERFKDDNNELTQTLMLLLLRDALEHCKSTRRVLEEISRQAVQAGRTVKMANIQRATAAACILYLADYILRLMNGYGLEVLYRKARKAIPVCRTGTVA